MLGARLMVSLNVCLSLSLVHLYVFMSLSLCLIRLDKIDCNADCLVTTVNSKRKKDWDKANIKDEKNPKRQKMGL